MNEFKYITGEKDQLLIILFYGQIRSQEAQILLEEVLTYIQSRSQKIVIFNFRDVTGFMPGAHAAFARVQATVRKEGKVLGLCSFRPEVKMALLQGGV
jgi:anti-anti-sigma regulatory factor